MGFRYVKQPGPDDGHVTATERLCLTEDRSRLVPDTDPEARWLFCVPGAAIKRADAERYGLLAPEPEPERDEPKGEEPEQPKARPAQANKARKPKGNK